jgi:hypothetical protein
MGRQVDCGISQVIERITSLPTVPRQCRHYILRP